MSVNKLNQSILSFKNKDEIISSEICSCFYCLAKFTPNEINEWVDEGSTAICPKCGIDSVVPGDISLPQLLLWQAESFT
jgi:hypothetical protein